MHRSLNQGSKPAQQHQAHFGHTFDFTAQAWLGPWTVPVKDVSRWLMKRAALEMFLSCLKARRHFLTIVKESYFWNEIKRHKHETMMMITCRKMWYWLSVQNETNAGLFILYVWLVEMGLWYKSQNNLEPTGAGRANPSYYELADTIILLSTLDTGTFCGEWIQDLKRSSIMTQKRKD